MKKIKAWVIVMWRPILAFCAVTLIIASILGFRLGTLTGGVSSPEQRYISSVNTINDVVKHPVYFMHKLPVYALKKLDINNLAYFRAISAVFATMAVVSCFFILREWYTDRVAILGTWLFLTSAWILHTGRLATPESSFLLLMPTLWAVVWLYNTTLHKTAWFVLSLLCAASFYIPGFGWLIIASAIWRHKSIWKELKQIPVWFRIFCGFTALLTLFPLILASVSSPNDLLLAAGLPSKLPTIYTLFQNLISIPMNLLLNGPNDPVRWLGRIPLLDVFSTAMLALGIYSIRFHLKLARAQILIFSSILFGLLITSGGPLTITALMPAVYFLIAGGLAFMLQQWFVVFPRNPIARSIGTTLISLSVILVSFYHISHYFIAWPGAPATKARFNHSLVK